MSHGPIFTWELLYQAHTEPVLPIVCPVVFDAKSTAATTGNGTSFNHNNLTVGVGNQRALVVTISWGGVPTSPTMTWNGVPMTLLTSQSQTDVQGSVAIFGLLNPDPGNRTLHGAWSGSMDFTVAAVSFTNAIAFTNPNTATGGTSPTSVTVTSDTGNAVVAAHGDGNSVAANGFSVVNNNEIYRALNATIGGAGNYASGASRVTMTGTFGAAINWAAAGINVTRAPCPPPFTIGWLPPFEPVPVRQRMSAALQSTTAFTAFVTATTPPVAGWGSPLSTPQRQLPGLSAANQQFLAYVEAAPFPETVTESRWHQPWSEPVRTKPGLPAAEQQFLALAPFPIVPTAGWDDGLEWPIPAPRLGLAAQQQQFSAYTGAAPFPETVTESRWHQPWSEPVRTRPGLPASQQQFLAYTPFTPTVTVNEDSWHQAWSDPVRVKPGLAASQQQFFAYTGAAPFPETVTEDRWHQPWSEPVRVKPALPVSEQPFASFVSVVVTTTPSVDGWGTAFTDPPKAKPGLLAAAQQFLAYVEAAPFAETVSEDRWHQPWSEPVRVKPALPVGEQPFLALQPNPIISIPWFGWLSEPVRQRVGLSSTAQQSLALQPPFVSFSWFNPFSEPVRTAARLIPAANQFEAFSESAQFAETVTESRWHQPWSEPVRTKPGLPASEQSTVAYSPFVVTTPAPPADGWVSPFAEVPKAKAGLTAAAQQFLAFNPAVFVAGPETWFQVWREPPKPKISLTVAAQQALVAVPFVEAITESRWHQPWSEPIVKTKAGLRTGDHPFLAFNYRQPDVSFGYFRPLSEPVRFRRFEVAYQLAFTRSTFTPIITTPIAMDVTETADVFSGVITAFNAPIACYVDIITRDPNHEANVGIIENMAKGAIVSISEPVTIPATGTPITVAGARVSIVVRP